MSPKICPGILTIAVLRYIKSIDIDRSFFTKNTIIKKVVMHRLCLIHWNAVEAEERVSLLQAAGFSVSCDKFKGPITLRKWRENPPDAFIIDLNRLPSQGRDVGISIRHFKTTRHVPLVFVEGESEKVKRIKQLLPDALFTCWKDIRKSLKHSIAHPPVNPIKPQSLLAGYSGTPLPKKLGIKLNSTVALVDAPQDFEKTLGKLPDGVVLSKKALRSPDLIVWFTRSRKDLEHRIGKIMIAMGKYGLWIVWPKKTSRLSSDLTQAGVREVGLASGLVDYKVCAVDETWSGLKFTRRKSK